MENLASTVFPLRRLSSEQRRRDRRRWNEQKNPKKTQGLHLEQGGLGWVQLGVTVHLQIKQINKSAKSLLNQVGNLKGGERFRIVFLFFLWGHRAPPPARTSIQPGFIVGLIRGKACV